MHRMFDALELAHVPAAIYEWPSLEFVARNKCGDELVAELATSGTHLDWVDLDLRMVRSAVEGSDDPVTFRNPVGIIVMSKLESYPLQPRPTVLLTSVHRDRPLAAAQGEHVSLRNMVAINEAVQIADEAVDAALAQLAAVKSAMDLMAIRVNHSFNEVSLFERKFGPTT